MKESIIFIGNLNTYSRSLQRYKALVDLGIQTTGLSLEKKNTYPGISRKPNLWLRVRSKIGYPSDETNVNQRLLREVENKNPHLVWIEKGLMIRASTLKILKKDFPKVKLVFFSEDDMYMKHNQSKYFLSCLPLYNYVFTTKSTNLNPDELYSLGAKNVIFVMQAFDPSLNYPMELNRSDQEIFGSDVSFIGSFESIRMDKLLFLAEAGIQVRVWGNGWGKYIKQHPNLKIENRPLYDEDYIKTICASKINLGFLRKINRDLHTSRSLEIPACGGFFLAEYSQDHGDLYEKDKEAVFFDINNSKELLEKVTYYLIHDEERIAIALAGRERCLNSGYSHQERLTWILNQII